MVATVRETLIVYDSLMFRCQCFHIFASTPPAGHCSHCGKNDSRSHKHNEDDQAQGNDNHGPDRFFIDCRDCMYGCGHCISSLSGAMASDAQKEA